MKQFQNPIQVLSNQTSISDVDLVFKPDVILITPLQALTAIEILISEYRLELLKYEKVVLEFKKENKIECDKYVSKYNLVL